MLNAYYKKWVLIGIFTFLVFLPAILEEMGSVTFFSQKVWHGPLDTSVTLLLH
jgi:hypothetical protein